MAEYGRAKQKLLSTFLSLPNGIPCADTCARMFARLDPEQMQGCFVSWANAISRLPEAEVVGIDGKTVRHSYDKGSGKAAIHMASAWASASRLVLGQRKVDDIIQRNHGDPSAAERSRDLRLHCDY